MECDAEEVVQDCFELAWRHLAPVPESDEEDLDERPAADAMTALALDMARDTALRLADNAAVLVETERLLRMA